MTFSPITALAHPNIAFIKYWGNRNPSLRLPSNGSLSMTLAELETRTKVEFTDALSSDQVSINEQTVSGEAYARVVKQLDRIRTMANIETPAIVNSHSNFPHSAGLASSASGFAALTLAASTAAGIVLSQVELSRLARKASGSACRSIFGGFVEWYPGEDDQQSYAEQLADQDYWELMDVIAIVSDTEKETGSTEGHASAETSPLQPARVVDTPRRLQHCREAILNRDFPSLAKIIEEDSNMMHAVMLTSSPPILYWKPATIAIMQHVQKWRAEGLQVCYTIDAGANVHCICPADTAQEVERAVEGIEGVIQTLTSGPGGPARVIS